MMKRFKRAKRRRPVLFGAFVVGAVFVLAACIPAPPGPPAPSGPAELAIEPITNPFGGGLGGCGVPVETLSTNRRCAVTFDVTNIGGETTGTLVEEILNPTGAGTWAAGVGSSDGIPPCVPNLQLGAGESCEVWVSWTFDTPAASGTSGNATLRVHDGQGHEVTHPMAAGVIGAPF
jgi:hypothetical protein